MPAAALPAAAPPAPRPVVGDGGALAWWADVALGLFLILWMAEALVRLPAQPALTAAAYAGLAVRMAPAAALWVPVALRLWPMLLFPAVCLASALWSPVPTVSLVAAVQLTATILAGVWLGARFGLAGLFALLVLGLGAALAASAVNLAGLWPPTRSWEGGFLGIFTNKNALGSRAALLIPALLVLLAQARGVAGRVGWAAALAGAAALLAASLSVTSWLMAAGVAVALPLWAVAALGPGGRGAAVVVAVTGAALAGAALWVWVPDPLAALLQATGKSPTLTGRTMLWSVAGTRIADAPALGLGYMAYWQAPAFAQEVAILTRLYGSTVSAFHAFPLEVLVATGPAGLAAMALLLARAGTVIAAAPPGAARRWAALTLGILVAFGLVGSSLYRPHEVSLLLAAALAAGAVRDAAAAPARPDAPAS